MLDGILLGAFIATGAFICGFAACFLVQRYHEDERREWGRAYGALQQKLAEAERMAFEEEKER